MSRAVFSGTALGSAGAVLYVFLWGSAFVPSKIGVLASSPLWFLFFRFALSGAIALGIALAYHARWPKGIGAWATVAALGVLSNAVYLGLSYEALRHLAAGVGAIISSTNPLMLALVAPFVLHEPLGWRKALGLILGFGGVVWVMVARTGTGSADPRDVGLALAGVAAAVSSTVIFKRFLTDLDLPMTNALQLLAAAVAVLPGALLTEGAPHAQWGAPLVLSFVWTVLVMSVGSQLLWFWLLTRGQASRVSAYFFLSPVFGLVVASFFGEPLLARDLGGLIAIACGIAIVQRA
jgi:drug/metabolite transporter (DMT)-like permease